MKYTLEGGDVYINKMQQLGQDALLKVGMYLESKLKDEVYKDSYDLGNFASSITTNKVNNHLVEVWSNLTYWIVREVGRQPGKFPNLNAMVGRTYRHRMQNESSTKPYDSLGFTAKWVVFIISRSIARKGIKGKHTFRSVAKREADNIKNLYVNLIQW